MKKRLTSTVAAFISIIVLVITLVILVKLPHDIENLPGNELVINSKTVDDISFIDIRNSNDAYTVTVNNGTCFIDELMDLPISENKFATLTSDCVGITAAQIIDNNSSDISVFGLSTPRATVNIKYNDKKSLKLNIGAEAPFSEGVYVNVNDGSTVYLFSSDKVDSFFYSKIDFIDKAITPKTESDKTALILKKATLEGTSRPEAIVFELESTDASYNTYKITSPSQKATDANQISSIVDQLHGLEAEDVIAINPNDEQLAQYGLLQPYSKITAEYSSTYVTLITSVPQDDKVYIMNPKIPIIYRMASKDKTFITAQYYDIASKTIISPTLSTVKKLTVSSEGSYYAFNISFDNEQKLSVKCNGKDIDPESFKTYYQNIIGMRNQGFTTESLPASQAVLTYKFDYIDSNKSSDVVSFYQSSDPNKVLIDLNNNCDSFEYMTYVDKIILNSYNTATSAKVKSNK